MWAVTSVGLYLWDIAESIATVIAACIPTLRVLIRKDGGWGSRLYETREPRGLSDKSPRTPSFFKVSIGSSRLTNDQSTIDRSASTEVELGNRTQLYASE
jgi:hypothetical protein